jgi:putative hemolysin
VLSAVFSCTETAVLSIGKMRLDYLTRRSDRRAILLQRLLRQPDELVATILIGNNIVNTVATVLATSIAFFLLKEHAVLITAVGMTLLVLVVGEIFPKVLATQFSERLALTLARPFTTIRIILLPVVKVFTTITNLGFGLFGVKVEGKRLRVTRDELRHAVRVSAESGHLKGGEEGMLHRIFEFNDRLAQEVMVPRERMVLLNKKASREEILTVLTEQGYSRLPVYEDSHENIVGIIHAKDILNLLAYKELFILDDLIRKPRLVFAKQPISEVLRIFQKERKHIAIVVDEKNLPIGLITMEDVLEEIVGDIEDEHDA